MAAKYQRLAAELRQLCLRMRRTGQSKLPGELTLCEQFHCSRETVRHALGLLEAEGLIVRAHGSGTYLAESRRPRNTQIAIIFPSLERYLYPQLLRDLEKLFSAEGYTVKAYASESRFTKEREILETLLSEPPAGILLEGVKTALPCPNLDLLAQIEKRQIPLVYLRAAHELPEGSPCIQDENAEGARQLTQYLLQKGHHRIAALFKSDDRQGAERFRGFVSAILDAGQELCEDSIGWFDTVQGEEALEGRDAWLCTFIRTRLQNCSAVICHNDEIAYPLVRCLLAEKRRIPDDLAVVSFDNSHYSRSSPVPITSLTHERHQISSLAAETLLARIRGQNVRSLSLPWTIRVRDSG